MESRHQSVFNSPGAWCTLKVPKPKRRQPPSKTHRIDDGSFAHPAKWHQWSEYATQQEQKWQKPAWQFHHYHGHRDRRDLFDRSLFKMDLKSCILRTICGSKRLLLPPGYSMLLDMLRVVFM
ncbi:Hypothetical predicted protein [Drosophila guanche]|uniref:Uncharacterized protein n=1 Tax=Drosophila guanche TaxID=7266 RepID=A0A3B0JSD0_DROGU|nr:Hypothetical predicted protein [Drosophila guanche]